MAKEPAYTARQMLEIHATNYMHSKPDIFFPANERKFAVIYTDHEKIISESRIYSLDDVNENGELKIYNGYLRINDFPSFRELYEQQDINNELLTIIYTPEFSITSIIYIDYIYSFDSKKAVNELYQAFYDNIQKLKSENSKFFIHAVFRNRILQLNKCRLVTNNKINIKGISKQKALRLTEELEEYTKDDSKLIMLIQELTSGYVVLTSININ